MADYIDPIDDKRRDEAVSSNMQAVMAAMVAIRQHSVLKTDVPLPVDSVGTSSQDSTLAQAARIARLTRLVMTEQARGQKLQVEGNKAEVDVDNHLRHDHEKLEATTQQDNWAQDEAVQNRDAARQFNHQSAATAASFGGSRQADRMAAFLKARGYEKLKKAGQDPSQIQAALDDLAESDVDADTAASLYQGITTRFQEFDSEAALAAMFGNYSAGVAERKDEAKATATQKVGNDLVLRDAAQTQIDQGAQLVMQADELPWNITPVKT
ncbi:MAG TPA: hypothetical protein VGO93_01345 [Candidatus Xenobia bacterium]|jgi:hypothetical protein